MQIDKTTLHDLAIINTGTQLGSVLSLFSSKTRSTQGKHRLRKVLEETLPNITAIEQQQQTFKAIINVLNQWPTDISNGTLLVIEKFYADSISNIPTHPGTLSASNYKLFNKPDYNFLRYAINHFIDFAKGIQAFLNLFTTSDGDALPLQKLLKQIAIISQQTDLPTLASFTSADVMNDVTLLKISRNLIHKNKSQIFKLIEYYSLLDAWYALALGIQEMELSFPQFHEKSSPFLQVTDLYNILLPQAVPSSIDINDEQNFVFLTGANMAGKSTFIKAVGIAVYLAHLGIGVPAKQMELSFFDGILSNINVQDDLQKGESFFYNEVQRINTIVDKIGSSKKWLILIDELFKGTNVIDAMKCSLTVINGLVTVPTSLFVLSTHLYEIAETLQQNAQILFYHFETEMVDGNFSFSYRLKEGVSNDRLGYLILEKEGVTEKLKQLAHKPSLSNT